MPMNQSGVYTPEQQGTNAAPVMEPQNLEYGNQPEMMQPIDQTPQPQKMYAQSEVPQEMPAEPVYEQPMQYTEVPQETPQGEQIPAPVYQEMYPQNPMHPVTFEAAPQDFGTETYSVPEGIEQAPQIPQTVERPNLYQTPSSQEVIKTSEMPALQERLVRQSREGEKVFINPELGLQGQSQGQTQVIVTQQQVVSAISGYPVSNALSTNPLAALIQQTVASGDPHAGTTWQATIISKIATVLSRLIPR